MKQFFKYVLATMTGIVALGILFFLFSMFMLVVMLASGEQKPLIKEGSVLKVSLTGTLKERAEDNPLAIFQGNRLLENQGLSDLLTAIQVAKNEKKVAGIYIEAGALMADFATVEELRKALEDFKAAGKFVVAYADHYTQSAYYVSSVADEVMLNPNGMLDWHGIATELVFYKELLDRLGVKMQVFKVGTYKSAVEPYILTQMSEANRAQVSSFIGDIWQTLCTDVSTTRGISVDSLNAYADRYMALADGEAYVRMNLVDTLVYADQVRERLRTRVGGKRVRFVTPTQLAQLRPSPKRDGKVAVYYAEGTIVDQTTGGMLHSSEIVGSKVVRDLDELASNDAIKAVVVRINSGGGSAFASEQMWHAIELLRAKKPVVVSMGGLAASGGYYMGCGADYIYAEPTTLTGSIGIFGIVPDASALLTEKLGVHFDVVKTNVASDFGAMGRPFNVAEGAAMQAYVDRGYQLFLQRVSSGRNLSMEMVDSIAQGRVWTGRQALELGLVDQLGTLAQAVANAASRANLDKYSTVEYPAPTSFLEALLDNPTDNYMERKLREALGVYYEPLHAVRTMQNGSWLQARMMFEPNFR